jgi:hydrogenase expression/formation protein HypD
MKYIDEYRNPEISSRLLETIKKRAQLIGRTVIIMEVCGSHTYAIGHNGIRSLLPDSIKLISGPGCPVCVTSGRDVDTALYLASRKNVIFTTFGDMLRVPGSRGNSLQKIRAEGADVRVVSSTLDVIEIAKTNPNREVIFMGIGFETTSPTIASMVKKCSVAGIKNLSVFSVHKIVPPAIKVLLDDPELAVDGFLGPGHVSVIIGFGGYAAIPERGKAVVITGFEPVDILQGILMILNQIVKNEFSVQSQYSRGVNPQGNTKAQALLNEVFIPAPSEWRGIGVIDGSGLVFCGNYRTADALTRFDVPQFESEEIKGCMCGSILRGVANPHECPLFRRICTPQNPIGPCMVSREGTCSTYYKCH